MNPQQNKRAGLVLSLGLLSASTLWAADPEYVPDVGPGTVFYPALSGDGQTMAWADGQSTPYLALQNLDTNAQNVLDLQTTTGDADLSFPNVVLPSLSDDGTRAAMMADGPSGSRNPEILLVVSDTGAELARVTALDSFGAPTEFRDDVFISGDGRYVVFSGAGRTLSSVSAGGNDSLVVTNDVENVFRLDTQTGDLELVSVDQSGGQPNDDSYVHGISENGRYVLFSSYATDLPNATGEWLAYRRDMSGSAVLQVSIDETGDAISSLDRCGTYCRSVGLSDDGTRVVFTEDRRSSADGESHTYVWIESEGSTEITAVTEYGHNALSGNGLWLAPEVEAFSRLNIGDSTTDVVTFAMEETRISDDGSVLLFFNDTLTKPVVQDGDWWVLRYTTTPPPPVDTTPPSWPGGSVTATQLGLDAVSLNWTAAVDGGSGVKQYVLYRGTTEIARQPLRTFTDGPLPFGTYGYRVEAEDIAGNASIDGPTTSITLAPAPIDLRVDEAITMSDNMATLPGLLVQLDEVIAVADDVRNIESLILQVTEAIMISDQASTLAALMLQISEQIAVTDAVATEQPLPSNIIELLINGPLYPGDTFGASAEGFKPFSLVQAFLQSTPVLVGEESADAFGDVNFVITVPENFPPGPHTLVLKGIGLDGSERRLEAPITIDARPPDSGPGGNQPLVPVPGLSGLSILLLLLGLLVAAYRPLRRPGPESGDSLPKWAIRRQ